MAYPKTVTVSCDPNPPIDAVTAYKFSLDGGTPQSSPTPSVSMSVPTPGSHVFSVVATNVEGDSTPTSITQVFPAKPSAPVNLHII